MRFVVADAASAECACVCDAYCGREMRRGFDDGVWANGRRGSAAVRGARWRFFRSFLRMRLAAFTGEGIG